MDILVLLLFSLFLCIFVAIIIASFPVSYPRETMMKGLRRIQVIFITCSVIVSILIALIHFFLFPSLILIDSSISLLLVPAISALCISLFLYYPSTKLLIQINLCDQKTMDRLLVCIFRCAYLDAEGSKKALSELSDLINSEATFIQQYGIEVYLDEYLNQAKYTYTNKPSETIIKCVLDRCNQVMHDIDTFIPMPFQNIGLILSFLFSTLLTILIAIITTLPAQVS